jgi:hypothetical protein
MLLLASKPAQNMLEIMQAKKRKKPLRCDLLFSVVFACITVAAARPMGVPHPQATGHRAQAHAISLLARENLPSTLRESRPVYLRSIKPFLRTGVYIVFHDLVVVTAVIAVRFRVAVQ